MKPTLSILLILLIILTVTTSYGQSKSYDTIYKNPEVKARFKKGELELNRYAIKQFLPIIRQCEEKENSTISCLFMHLTIDSKGKIIDVRFTRARLSQTCKAELKKELLTMKGWQPALQNEKPVCSIYILPIHCLKREQNQLLFLKFQFHYSILPSSISNRIIQKTQRI